MTLTPTETPVCGDGKAVPDIDLEGGETPLTDLNLLREAAEKATHRAFRFRLYPTPAQVDVLRQFTGTARFIYNLALEQRRDFWRQYRRAEGRPISFASQCRELTALRAQVDWIRSAPSQVGAAALRDVDRAFSAFLAGRSAYPTPRRRDGGAGFRIKGEDAAIRRLNRRWATVNIPKLGRLKFRISRDPAGHITSATISERAGHWYISFAASITAEQALPAVEAVGIDRGIAQTLTLSDGLVFQAPKISRLRERAAQRALARCRKGSARRDAAKARVAALRARSARIRTDWCHRTSTAIARSYGLVAIEALNIKAMTASAAGTVEAPGRGVRQKAGLNRSILEQCWGKFARQLDYKLTERGGTLVSVPAAYTSQTCASCGVVDARSRESQAVFKCVHCGHTDNADVNAAKEILRRSTVLMGVEGPKVPAKRQPQENVHA